MIGKRVAEMMKIKDEVLLAGISYTMAYGETERCRGVTKRKVKVCLNEGTPDEACVYLHILVDNATSYDVLIGAHFTHCVTNNMNFRESYVEYSPNWSTTTKRTARFAIDLYATPDQQTPGGEATGL